MATLKEVARLAGVSASTVSRIINGKGEKCAGAAVQKRVWDAVRATGYVPNQEAKRLKEGGGTPKEAITVSCLFARAEDYKEVTRLCEGGVVANPDRPEFYFYLAIAYNQDGRTDDVIATCQKALQEAREGTKKEVVSDFFTIMGDAYYEKKQTQLAYAAYDSALVYHPENIPALNNYAYYLSLERRDLDRAEEMSYKTIKAEPKNATYLDTYAWILFEKGNYAEARIYIDDAMLGDTEKSGGIVEHGGDIYYMTGDADKAVELWQKAREMGIQSEVLERKIKEKKYIPYENHVDGEKATEATGTPQE